MDSVGVFFLSDLNDDEHENHVTNSRIQRRILRDGSDPLSLPEKRFIKLFRLSKDGFQFLLDSINEDLVRRNKSAIPPILKIAATLRFLAEGSYQQAVGQDFLIAFAQSTVSTVLKEVLNALETILCPQFIKFPSAEERNATKKYFYDKSGFPGIIGCVDGTHVNIKRPTNNEHHFYNRKGEHSVNAMIMCNHKLQIVAINARYGGASHDSFVWSMSSEKKVLEDNWNRNDKSSWCLGDSGYALEPFMMTPFRLAATNSREAKYNQVHSECRSKVERCIGVLKGRFRCLLKARQLQYEPQKASKMINVACMLHNLCITFNVAFEESLFVNEQEENIPELSTSSSSVAAKRIREQIKNAL